VGETVSSFIAPFNGSVRVAISGALTSSDGGALALRETLDASGVIEGLEAALVDPRQPAKVRHSLGEQIRTVVLQRALGWIDQADTDVLREDPVLALCCSSHRGTTPLERARPSQPTLPRLFALLAEDANIGAMHEGLMALADWRLRSLEQGRRPDLLTLDIDGVPIEVFGEQGGSAYNGHTPAHGSTSP